MGVLNDEQKQKVKGFVVDQAVSTVAKPLIHRIGDAMAKSKRPFIRNVVRFFRGEPK